MTTVLEKLQSAGFDEARVMELTGWYPVKVWRILNQKIMPNKEDVRLLHQVTGGLVDGNDFYGITEASASEGGMHG